MNTLIIALFILNQLILCDPAPNEEKPMEVTVTDSTGKKRKLKMIENPGDLPIDITKNKDIPESFKQKIKDLQSKMQKKAELLLKIDVEEDGQNINILSNKYDKMTKENTVLYVNKVKKEFSKEIKFDKKGINQVKIVSDIEEIGDQMFHSVEKLLEVNFIRGKASKKWDKLFYRCRKLERISIEKEFDTSGLESVYQMFYYCINFKDDSFLKQIDTYSLKSISFLFYGCSALETVKFPRSFDTSQVADMSGLFNFCEKLTSVDFGKNFSTRQVTDMRQMFESCVNLKSIDFGPKFETNNLVNINDWFESCLKLEKINFRNSLNTKKVNTMMRVFSRCYSLTSLELGDNFYTAEVTDMYFLFSNCDSLTSLELGNKFNTGKVTNMANLFFGCSNLTSLNLGKDFDTSNVKSFTALFAGCTKLKTIDLGNKFNVSSANSLTLLFRGCSSLEKINFGKNFETNSIKKFDYMFKGCKSLFYLDLSQFTFAKAYDKLFETMDCSGMVIKLPTILPSDFNKAFECPTSLKMRDNCLPYFIYKTEFGLKCPSNQEQDKLDYVQKKPKCRNSPFD